MWTRSVCTNALLLVSTALIARAADCKLDQIRKEGDLSGQKIVEALNSHDNLNNVCAGNWRTADEAQLENSFSWWGMMWTIQRTNKEQSLRYCKDAMQNIMDQCITGGNYWGGSWSLNGEIYTIQNSLYPADPKFPADSSTTPPASSTATANTGPITMGPQASVEEGKFSTTTRNIEGLTANSVTTTTADNHATVLPIWFAGPGIGIIVIPIAGVVPGGLVPPPPGYPHLSIGPDGRPSSTNIDKEDQDKTSTKSTPSSISISTSSSCDCSSCTLASVADIPEPSNIADLEPGYPFIIPGGQMPSGTTSGPTAPATQSAVPIDKPKCNQNDAKAAPERVQVTGGNIDLKDLLFRIRQNLCAGPCAAPDGVRAEAVNVTSSSDGQACAISVRISQSTEAYAFRTSAPVEDQWQQCWDSTENIINQCLNNNVFVGQKGNEGWWNGNHVYQFYQVGFRAWTGAPSPWWLPPTGITHPNSEYCLYHYPLCTGYGGKPAQSIGRRDIVARKRRDADRLLARESQSDICRIQYNLPDYPSTSNTRSPGAGAAQNVAGISKWFDMRDISQQGGICNWQLYRSNDRVDGHDYATEHVWEKHFIKTFLNWLSHDSGEGHGAVTDCAGKTAVFGSLSTTPNSPFNQITPAQALANSITCYGGNCPDDSRVSEFLILEAGVNGMKTRVLGRLSVNDNPMMPSNSNDWATMRTKMVQLSMAFAYMRNADVVRVFNDVNNRMRQVLKAVDADPFYTTRPMPQAIGTTPETYIAHLSWTDAYDYWLSGHLHTNQIKSDEWMHNVTLLKYPDAVNADTRLTQREKEVQIAWAAAHRNSGLFSQDAISFGHGYDVMMGVTWKVRND